MSNERLGPHYFDTGLPVQNGDQVTVDGHAAVVKMVFLPESLDADEFDCIDTGGILFQMDKYGSTIIPFGHSCFLRRVQA